MKKLTKIPRVTTVEVRPPYGLQVTFDDGLTRDVDLAGELWGPMFEPLREPTFFAQAAVDHGTVAWPNGLDLDPLVLHGDFEPATPGAERSLDINGSQVPTWMGRYPPADISPSEFEEWVGELFASVGSGLEDLHVSVHEAVAGVDGSYDFDATVRYSWAGLKFLVVVEAKRHTNPIKREVVQGLHSKIQSVGAHKGVVLSTAPFQSGAIEFANVHGIALVSVTEGRFTYQTRTLGPAPILSREQARERLGLPTFVGYCDEPGDSPGSTVSTLISTEHPEYIKELLLAVPDRPS